MTLSPGRGDAIMLGPFRRSLIIAVLGWASVSPIAIARAQESPPKPTVPDPQAKPTPADFGLPGEDPPKAFVPARARTVEEQKRVDSLRYYAAGRAYEERHQFSDAIKSFEKALESEPASTPVLRRLSRINFALGRDDAAVDIGRRILAADPGDVETIELLLRHFRQDPAASEALLLDVAKNPKLDKKSIGALFVEYELGNLFEASLQFDKAAAAFAKVVEAIDDKSNARLSASDLRRFLGNEEAQTYLRFGRVFLLAKRTDLAIKAFQRGLIYDPDDPQLLLSLSEIYLDTGKADEALGQVERFLKRQPQGREPYDQLARILTTLKRENEIIPRFEKYAADSPKNLPLQFALAERYNQAGQPLKAEAIFKALLAEQRDTQGFVELFPKLLKDKKWEELIQLLSKVAGKLKQLEAIQPQIDLLLADPVATEAVLDAGLKLLSSNPPALDIAEGYGVLYKIAYESKKFDKLVELLRWSLKRVPNPFTTYRELIITYYQAGKYAEAEAVWKEMIDRFPDERTSRMLMLLAEVQSKGGRLDAAMETTQEALRLEPNDPEAVRTLVNLLVQTGKTNDAVALLQGRLKQDPNNAQMGLMLGFVLTQALKHDEAITLYKNLIERFANDEEIIKRAHSGLSIVYTNLNDFPKAEAELETIFARDPEDAGINNDLGYLYADQGKNLEKAEAMIRKAVAEEPDNYAYLDSLGWVLFKRGKFQEARIPLEKAQGDPRQDATIPDHLGDVYFQLQELPKAKAAWERALKIANEAKPPDKKLGEIKKKLQGLEQYTPSPKPKTGDTP
jgi:tetratricopeptide (TPR) repeat protein